MQSSQKDVIHFNTPEYTKKQKLVRGAVSFWSAEAGTSSDLSMSELSDQTPRIQLSPIWWFAGFEGLVLERYTLPI